MKHIIRIFIKIIALFSKEPSRFKDLKIKYNVKLKINFRKYKRQIENFNECGITETMYSSSKIIVSLTTFPPRIHLVYMTIYSLLTQSLKPNKIILYLANEQFPNHEADLPETLLALKKNGLEIAWCEDIKSYKKLVPVLQSYPNDVIITADDDIIYPNNWLEKLLNAHIKNPKIIFAHRVHQITFNEKNEINPYLKWNLCVKKPEASSLLLPTGGAGVLYPPHSLYIDVSNKNLFMNLAPRADDLWFFAMAKLQGTSINLVSDPIKEEELITTLTRTLRKQSLFAENKTQNDTQLQAIMTHYPELLQKLKR